MKETDEKQSPLKEALRNAALTAGLLMAAALICLLLKGQSGSGSSAQLVFVLAVMLVSRLTKGYLWGIVAAVVSVLGVNYVFTYPYFAFNLSISGYLLTFLTMLAVALMVSLMTTQIKRQERLRMEGEKEKMRADLLRAVSHDLRTPLTSILGATSAILDNDLPVDKQRELLKDANQDAQWLVRMIENLLAITRIGGDAAPIQMEAEVVEDVLAEAVIKFRKHFPGVHVELMPSDDVLLADMDAVLIEQVVQNLMENAVYHGETTQNIWLSVRHDGQFVYVSVEDDGHGVRKDILPKLFSGALQSAQQRSDKKRNMGIGLSVCMSVIKAHGGTMTAKNRPQGGASFTFSLPEKEMDMGNDAQGSDY